MIIDSHAHMFSPAIISRRADIVDPMFSIMYGDSASKMVDAEQLIDDMNMNGIQSTVICNQTWIDNELVNENNDYILDMAKKYPGRIIPLVSLPYFFDERDVLNLNSYFKNGACGVGEQRFALDYLTDHNLKMILLSKLLMEQHKVLLLHASEPVGHVYPGKEKITPEALYPFLGSVYGLDIVLAHFGGGFGFYALMKEVKEVLKYCYFDTAATPYVYSPEIYTVMKQLVGCDRILFGTDYPLISSKRVINHMAKSDLTSDDIELILHKNAESLFGLNKES